VYSLDGKPAISLGATGQISWAARGVVLIVVGGPSLQSFFVPLAPGQILPRVPPGGFRSDEDIARLPGARKLGGRLVVLSPTPDVYTYYRGNTQRNLYRIPVP
jgi:hypothetical protein